MLCGLVGRVPAMLNGCVGIKPTVRKVSSQGLVPACRSLDCISCFARTVEDGAKVVKLMEVGPTKTCCNAICKRLSIMTYNPELSFAQIIFMIVTMRVVAMSSCTCFNTFLDWTELWSVLSKTRLAVSICSPSAAQIHWMVQLVRALLFTFRFGLTKQNQQKPCIAINLAPPPPFPSEVTALQRLSETAMLQRAGSLQDSCWRPPPSALPHRPLQNGTHAPSNRQDVFCNPKFRFGVPSPKHLQFEGPGGHSTAERTSHTGIFFIQQWGEKVTCGGLTQGVKGSQRW